MRRILLSLFIGLLTLQSFAGVVMNTKMGSMGAISMETLNSDIPAVSMDSCFHPSDSTAVEKDNCCDSSAICAAICHLAVFIQLSTIALAMDAKAAKVIGQPNAFINALVSVPNKPPIL